MFEPGQEVECAYSEGSACLVVGRIYTCLGVNNNFLKVDCCSSPHHQSHCGWFKTRFIRHLHKTDISVFTAILNTKKVDELV